MCACVFGFVAVTCYCCCCYHCVSSAFENDVVALCIHIDACARTHACAYIFQAEQTSTHTYIWSQVQKLTATRSAAWLSPSSHRSLCLVRSRCRRLPESCCAKNDWNIAVSVHFQRAFQAVLLPSLPSSSSSSSLSSHATLLYLPLTAIYCASARCKNSHIYFFNKNISFPLNISTVIATTKINLNNSRQTFATHS